jgi:membrane-associated phospholipid phosphatase
LLYLTAFAAAAVATGVGRAVVTTYLPLLLQQVSDKPGLIGTVLLVNAAAGFFVPLVIGRWRDRQGARLPFLAGGAVLTGGGLAAVAFGSGTTYLALAAAGAVVYIGLNTVTTVYRALVPTLFGPSEQARANSVQEGATLAGTLLGVAGGGALTELAPWVPFAAAAIVVPLLTVVTVFATGEGERAGRAEPGEAISYYLQAATRPRVRPILAAQLLWVLGYAALPAFFILYAKEVLGLEPSVSSLALAAFGIVTGLTILAAARVRDPGWHKPLVLAGVTAMGVGLLAVSFATDLISVGLALAPAAIGFGIVSALGFPLFAAQIPRGEEGAYTALFFSSRSIASAIALPAAGWLIALSGSYRALFVLGGIATLAALVPLMRAPAAGPSPVAIPALGWYWRIVVTLVLLPLGTVAFGLLAAKTELADVDHWLFRQINEHGPGPVLFWDVINPHLRNYAILGLIPALLALATNARHLRVVAAAVAGSTALSLAFLYAIYAVWDRARPEEVLGEMNVELMPGHSYGSIPSYPSGHLVVTTALAAAAAWLFPVLRVPAWVYVAVVGFSRVLFGSHFPSDVIGGIALGLGCTYVVWTLLSGLSLVGRTGENTAQSTRKPSRTGLKELFPPG